MSVVFSERDARHAQLVATEPPPRAVGGHGSSKARKQPFCNRLDVAIFCHKHVLRQAVLNRGTHLVLVLRVLRRARVDGLQVLLRKPQPLLVSRFSVVLIARALSCILLLLRVLLLAEVGRNLLVLLFWLLTRSASPLLFTRSAFVIATRRRRA